MKNNSNNCLGACDNTEIRCLEEKEGIATSKIVTNSVGVFFDYLLNNVERESSESDEDIEIPSEWFIRGWRENYDEIMEDIRNRKARKIYRECYESLKQKVEAKRKSICSPIDLENRKSKPFPTNYDEPYFLGHRDDVNSNENNNSSSDIVIFKDDNNLTSGRKEKKGNKRKPKRDKENKKDRNKTPELPNSLNGISFYTGNVLPRIKKHVGPADEGDNMSESECYAPSKDTTDSVDKYTGRRNTNSSQNKQMSHEVQEVGKTEEQKFFEKDKRILSSLINKINQQSGKKFCPVVLKDETPAAVNLTKESDLDVVKFRAQFNNKCAMLPQIGQTNAKNDIGHIMQVEEHAMDIKEKKKQFSKDFIINMKKLQKERIEEYVNKMEVHVSCSNPHGDSGIGHVAPFAPQPPQGKPNAPRRGRRFKPSLQIPDEKLLYMPHAPGLEADM